MQDQGVDVGFLDGEGEGEVCEGGGQGVDDLFFEGRGAVVGHVVGVLAGGWGVFGLDLWRKISLAIRRGAEEGKLKLRK